MRGDTTLARAYQGQPWERQPGEHSKAYHHFALYRDLGPARSLRKMKSVNGCTSLVRQLSRWSSHWQWTERCRAYDDYLEQQRRIEMEQERLRMARRQARLGMRMQEVAGDALAHLNPEKLDGHTVSRLARDGVQIERVARGVSTENQAVAGEFTVTICDVE